MLPVKKRVKATGRLFGVKGDGMCRKSDRGTWEAHPRERTLRKCITEREAVVGVGEAHSSEEVG
jgi:hypothetical protein